MSILSSTLAILKRPVVQPVQAPVKVAAATGRKPAPPDESATPVTEAELINAIGATRAERQMAMDTIISAESRREALLFVEDSDDEIAQIGRETDSASLTLERLDRLEPELHFRLDQVRDRDRMARWIVLRDAYVAAGRAHAEALRAIKLDVATHNRVLKALINEFPDAWDVIPTFFFFDQRVAALLDARLNRLSTLQYRSKGQPPAKILESIVDLAKRGETTSAFGGGLTDLDDSDKQEIKLKVPSEINGKWHAAGSVLSVPKWLAENEITSKRAVLVPASSEGTV